jgi:hypothetical protein
MTKTPEQLEELIRRVQNHGDLSVFHKDPQDIGSVNLVAILANIPKANPPKPNLLQVRNKVLDRISLPQEQEQTFGFWQYIPRFVRITGGIVGAFMILLSLTLGTAVAALESVPGQTIYPVKKIVENVQMKMANTEEERTNLQIKFSNNRVDELEAILHKQQQGKISGQEVQKIVEETAKDIQKTTQALAAEQNLTEPKTDVLNKIVSLNTKQVAIIQAAQENSDGDIKAELEKALETSKDNMEQAIENIEKAGLVVENKPVVLPPTTTTFEGKVTAINSTSINIGTNVILLTKDTRYVNIIPADVKVNVLVKITVEIRDKKNYATKIEFSEVKQDSTVNDESDENEVNPPPSVP